MPIGPYRFEYEVIEGWEKLPEGWSFVEVAGVAVDSRDRVYVFNRGKHPLIIFDKSNFQTAGVPADPNKGYGDAHIAGFKTLWGL